MTDEWIGKQFDVTSDSQANRKIGLTLAVAGNAWTATDPRGIIDPDSGTWQSNNVNTDCRAAGRSIINLVGCGFANVAVGATGIAQVAQAQDENFTWRCTKFIT